MALQTIDINCDMGEFHPETGDNNDVEIMPFISSCNIACTFHSGNKDLMQKTVSLAIKHGVNIGAHPSYNDRAHFGRKSISITTDKLLEDIQYQLELMIEMCRRHDVNLSHVKPHGALYLDLHKNEEKADNFLEMMQMLYPNLSLMGMANSRLSELCKVRGIHFIHEAFADRKYDDSGVLRSRQYPDAVINDDDHLLAQVSDILSGYVLSASGKKLHIKADSICVHSDTQSAVKKVKKIRQYLVSQNVRIHKYR